MTSTDAGGQLIIFDNATTGHHLGLVALIGRSLPSNVRAEVHLPDCMTDEQFEALKALPGIRAITKHRCSPTNSSFRTVRRCKLEYRALRQILARDDVGSVVHLNGDSIIPLLAVMPKLGGPVNALTLGPAPDTYSETATILQRLRWRAARAATYVANKRGQVGTLMCMDPVAPATLARLGVSAIGSPDPVYFQPDAAPKNPPDDGVTRFIVFGSLSERKGVHIILDALDLIPDTQLIEFTIAGAVAPGPGSDRLRERLDSASRSARIRFKERFLSDDELWEELEGTDFVLLPYLHHRRSSGALIWSVVAGRPVVASSFGLVGKEVTDHNLGLTVDSHEPQEWAKAIITMANDIQVHRKEIAAARPGYLTGRTGHEFARRIVEVSRRPRGQAEIKS